MVLVALIHASGKPEGRQRRDAIRNTWASSSVLNDVERGFKRKIVYK